MILLLDVMGTLVHDPFFWEVPQFFKLRMEQLLVYKHPTAWIEFEYNQRSEDSFLQDFFEDGREYDRVGFCKMMRESYAWLDGMEELLRELHSSGVAMHALSNYPVWYKWIEERLELSRFLQWSFVSCDTGSRKPSREAYTHPAETLGVSASDCLFVDDRESNCEAAREAGMDAIRFVDATQLRAALNKRNVL